MTGELRFEALAVADGHELERVADAVLATGAPIEVVAGPEAVTTPLRLPIPGTASTAAIGHVALATCRVLLDGVQGDGCRTGRDLQGALAAAICDAEVRRRGGLAAAVDQLVEQALASQADTRQAYLAEVEATRLGGAS